MPFLPFLPFFEKVLRPFFFVVFLPFLLIGFAVLHCFAFFSYRLQVFLPFLHLLQKFSWPFFPDRDWWQGVGGRETGSFIGAGQEYESNAHELFWCAGQVRNTGCSA